MRDEIVSGIKNAIDRGSTMDQAVNSFINAGYNPVEVKQAASFLTSGATSIAGPNQQDVQKLPSNQQPQAQPKPEQPAQPQPTQTKPTQTPAQSATQVQTQPAQAQAQPKPEQPTQPAQPVQTQPQTNPQTQPQTQPQGIEEHPKTAPEHRPDALQPPKTELPKPTVLDPSSPSLLHKPKEKKKKTGLIITLAIILILLIGGLIGVIFYSDQILDALPF
tara:strand:+ start:1535 stop:2191 length:657 start_codon:yes stop_codon:yes gene_type:complete